MTVTEGTLLGGRVRYRQFATGHRSGFEPVLLAAAVPARAGEAVVEFGTGAGAALLCLAHRVPGVTGIGLEIDTATADLADQNFRLNDFTNVSARREDACSVSLPANFDHAISNPPWHDAAGTNSPDPARALAHHAGSDLLERWVAAMVACLKPAGLITIIVPAALMSRAAAALRAHRIGAIHLFPIWPRIGRPANQIILAGRRNAKGQDRLSPGLVLHDESGITMQADAILRSGAALF